jgi:hypothetical protein
MLKMVFGRSFFPLEYVIHVNFALQHFVAYLLALSDGGDFAKGRDGHDMKKHHVQTSSLVT